MCSRLRPVWLFIGSTRLTADFTALSDIFSRLVLSTRLILAASMSYAMVTWCSTYGEAPLRRSPDLAVLRGDIIEAREPHI